jgi:hypothetical protein
MPSLLLGSNREWKLRTAPELKVCRGLPQACIARSRVERTTILLRLSVALAAIAIALVGGFINAWYARSLGSTEVAGWLFLAVGVSADVAAFALPICAAGLWRNRQVGAAGAAWSLWLLTFAFAIMAGIGFASLKIADTTAGRRAIVASSTASADQRNSAIAAAERAVTTATKAREGECAKRGPNCRDREADERTALTAFSTAISAPVPVVAAIGTADPQTEAASKLAAWVSFGTMRPTGDDFSMLRLLLLALLPQIGGLLLMVSQPLKHRPDSLKPVGHEPSGFCCWW